MSYTWSPFQIIRCAHGIDYGSPCASCGRPYQPPPTVELPAGVGERIAAALERIADALESADARDGYNSALARWQAGEGRHPDDR